MSEALSRPVFLDTTVLSNFASTDSVEVLDDTLDSIVVVASVRDELDGGVRHGYDYLQRAVSHVDAELEVVAIDPDTDEFATLRERLDRGEVDSLLGALRRGGTIATDDLAARRLAAEREVDVTGSVGLLALGVERDHISVETADDWLDTWRRKRGYYAPVDSVADLLE